MQTLMVLLVVKESIKKLLKRIIFFLFDFIINDVKEKKKLKISKIIFKIYIF